MKRLFLLWVCLFPGLHAVSSACMNDYETNDAGIARSRSVMEQLQQHAEKEPWNVRRDRLRKELDAGGDYRVRNDLAVALAHTNQPAEAIKLLEQVEVAKPGLYQTAANLGTAYELSGDNERALEWIREGIARNPASHEGTEWLHVRILEAKLAIANNPNWFNTNSVLGPRNGEGFATVNAVGNRGEKLSLDQVKAALIYQLHERLQFVQPPEAVVGDLLLELGRLLAAEPTGIASGESVYNLAAKYLEGLPEVDHLSSRAQQESQIARFNQHLPRRRSPFFWVGYWILGGLLCYGLISLKRRIERALET